MEKQLQNKIKSLYSKNVQLRSSLIQSKSDNKKKQELIAKQAEQIKMLREALKKCIACSYNLDFEAGWMTSGLEAADEALSATEQE